MSESRELAGMAGLMRSIVTCIAGSLILGRAADLADARALVPDDAVRMVAWTLGLLRLLTSKAPRGLPRPVARS